jgi:hypothetical protein
VIVVMDGKVAFRGTGGLALEDGPPRSPLDFAPGTKWRDDNTGYTRLCTIEKGTTPRD